MISNLATTVFCCLNEMFRFRRDREGFLKMAPLLPGIPAAPLKTKCFALCFPREQWYCYSCWKTESSATPKALTSILAVSLFPEVVGKNYLL